MKKVMNPSIEDIPALKAIWCECFPEDSTGYCDFYFNNFFSPDHCLAVYNGQDIESTVYLFDGYYKSNLSGKIPMQFLYAVATAARYRRQGNFKLMLDACMKNAHEKGYSGLFCVPYDNVVHLYEHELWKSSASLNVFSFTCNKSLPNESTTKTEICSFLDFIKMRNRYLDKIGSAFYWVGKTERYMYDDIFTKGDVLKFKNDGNEYYAVCTIESDRLVIRETDFPLQSADILVSVVRDRYSYCGRMEIYSYYDSIKLTVPFSADKMQYGSYKINPELFGISILSDSYINIVAD